MYSKCQYVRSVTKMSFVTQALQNQPTARGRDCVAFAHLSCEERAVPKMALALPLTVWETNCWSGGGVIAPCSTRGWGACAQLRFRLLCIFPWAPAFEHWAAESHFVSLSLEKDKKCFHFSALHIQNVRIFPFLFTPECRLAHSLWC